MHRLLLIVLPIFIITNLGCERRDPASASPFHQDPADYVLLVAIDMSGSFREYMTETGRAYEFILHALDRYFRDRLGGQDQVIITQLSGNNRPLLWQGTPQRLRREFPDPSAFRDYLIAHADANSSRINDGIAESLDYVLHSQSVARGDAKTVALILSDMDDTHPQQDKSDVRLASALSTFAGRGKVGFYFCCQERLGDMRSKMTQAGINDYVLECDIHTQPPLPSFD